MSLYLTLTLQKKCVQCQQKSGRCKAKIWMQTNFWGLHPNIHDNKSFEDKH